MASIKITATVRKPVQITARLSTVIWTPTGAYPITMARTDITMDRTDITMNTLEAA